MSEITFGYCSSTVVGTSGNVGVRFALVTASARSVPALMCGSSTVATVALGAGDVVVSCHACGALTDEILERAAAARTRVAVMPCCHDFETCGAGSLGSWVDKPLAIDIPRAVRLERHGYRVWTQQIPSEITPKNRLLLGAPALD